MIYRFLTTIFLCLYVAGISSQHGDLTYYLPDMTYGDDVTTPADFFGFQPGEWHVSHDRLVDYMYTLAQQSDRLEIEEYARSWEQRPLVLLKITSPGNHSRMEDILQQRRSLCNPERSRTAQQQEYPIVIYQGYTVHGDEASGTNAAALVAYYLAAGESTELTELLDNVVILLDPCLNPDGYNRFTTWVNAHRGVTLTTDPEDREFDEAWPGGRTNHYWFDLNRDWLPAQHPESQGRLANFHKWKPVILTDHHEMGSESTFFFMPGIPTRVNPVTPEDNQELTAAIADYHAQALDEIGALYYSGESYDDFYAGKGSTYPDLNGCIGILFEQAGVEGHAVETKNGLLTFPYAIRNQVATSLSTQRAAIRMKERLADYQCGFYLNARREARADPVQAYVFGETSDRTRLAGFVDILLQHDIEVYYLAKGKQAGGFTGDGKHHFIVPTDQQQYRMIRSIFEQPVEFEDSLFYDVSAWTLPLAFNILYRAHTAGSFTNLLGERLTSPLTAGGNVQGGTASYAYIIPWNEHLAPAALYRLLAENVEVRVATLPFSLPVDGSRMSFGPGTLVVPVTQDMDAETLHKLVSAAAHNTGVYAYATHTGYTPAGPDLGSRTLEPLRRPEIALLVGDGVNRYDAGELWHLFDVVYGIPLTKLDVDRVGYVDLSRYNVILMADGRYRLDQSARDKLRAWVDGGGVLIVSRGGTSWASGAHLLNAQVEPSLSGTTEEQRPYASAAADRGSSTLGGAIVEVEMDLTHPLTFGYDLETLPVFRRGSTFYKPATNAYASPIRYTESPLLAGYVHDRQLDALSGSAAVVVGGLGSGRVIGFADNHAFRGFWWGTRKLIANAVFFGSTISGATTEPAPSPQPINK